MIGAYQHGLKSQYEGMKTETLMVLLYEGMVGRIRKSREAFQRGDKIPAKSNINRTMRICFELMEAINMEEGGETAVNLEKLYAYVIEELSAGNQAVDPYPHLDHAEKVLVSLLDGWKQLESKTAS